MKKTSMFVLAAALAAAMPSAFAQVTPAQDALRKAQDSYNKRDASSLQATNDALTYLAQAEAANPDAETKYKILILESRAHYFNAAHSAEDSVKLAGYLAAYTKADQARVLNDKLADGHYFFAISLGRWGETKGIIQALGKAGEVIEAANKAKETVVDANGATVAVRKTIDGQDGVTIDGYGPDRTLGRVYDKIPPNPFAKYKGDRKKSLASLEVAAAKAPNYPINVQYLAEVLAQKSDTKARAVDIVNKALARTETDYETGVAGTDASRAVEVREELVELKGLQDKLSH